MKHKIINLIKNKIISFKKKIFSVNINNLIKVLTLIIQLGLLIIAYKGLNLWQEEVKGLDRYNTAREGLTAIYRLRDELATVKSSDLTVDITVLRGGVTFDSEGEGKFKDKGHWTDSAFKYHLEELRKAIDDYYTLIPKIEVVIGDQTTQTLNTINFPTEYYYNLGFAMYELGCHPWKLEVQVDPEQDINKKCIELEKEFQDDKFLKLFLEKFDFVNYNLRKILDN